MAGIHNMVDSFVVYFWSFLCNLFTCFCRVYLSVRLFRVILRAISSGVFKIYYNEWGAKRVYIYPSSPLFRGSSSSLLDLS